MAKYSSVNFAMTFDQSDGGAPATMTSYITKFGDVVVSKGSIESTPFGVSAAQYLLGVIKKYEPIVIEGFYDDTVTTGPDAVWNVGIITHAVTRSFVITIGSTKTIGGEAWITDYKRGATVGDYTNYAVTIQATGTISEA